MSDPYIHGHAGPEHERLRDQAATLVELLHDGIAYPASSLVLEAGCGVGAQTLTLARRSPAARFTAIDVSAAALDAARHAASSAGLANVRFEQADLLALPFEPASFDHAFVCFVLEHLPRPVDALLRLARVIKPGGTVTIIEGDHGSTLLHPESTAARAAIQCQVELQRRAGGDALIGRRLHPLMQAAGLRDVRVGPRIVYVDGSRPDLVEGSIRRTFTAMVAGVRTPALAAGLTDAEVFDEGVRDLLATAEPGGTFCYTFFRGRGTVGSV